jgi:MFS family permease
MLIAFSIGGVLFGRLSDHWRQRKSPMLTGCAAMLPGFGVLAYQPDLPLIVIGSLLVCAAFGSGSMVVGFAFAKESVPARLAGTATGVHNMGVMTGTLIQLPLLGAMLDRRFTGIVIDGVRQYDLHAFKLAFAALFMWLVFSMACLLLARETDAKPFGNIELR